eukprot:m.7918 g.7918  ORF g.7918 m.7918 type:complete len:75 (+) comp5124_c0_seq1:45-269(+)
MFNLACVRACLHSPSLFHAGHVFTLLKYPMEKIMAARLAASHGPPYLDPMALMPYLTIESPATLAAIMAAVRPR